MNTEPKSHGAQTISVVIPVYQGADTLPGVVSEILAASEHGHTPNDVAFTVSEIVLVYDHGTDASDEVIRALAAENPIVRAVWLSRNFGQHAATFAGISSTTGDWVATLDEDGQQDPADLGAFLDTALRLRAQVVYGAPVNAAPHGWLRNSASKAAKSISNRVLGTSNSADYNSYRLLLGSISRGVAGYAASGVYLDVALAWVAGSFATVPITLRSESRTSGYNYRRLLGHFWRLVLTSGTQGLRLVSLLGVVFAVIGIAIALWVVVVKITLGYEAEGWASTIVVLLLTSGATLFSLGIIAEYVGVSVSVAMGRPAFLVVEDPATGPFSENEPKS